MREIKFRAWSLTEKRFLNNFDLRFTTINTGFEHPSIEWLQFTGLKDKNGVRIYEGDIIEEGKVYFDNEYLGFFVEMEEGSLERVKPLHDIPLIEILGNIHENPELLK